MKKNIKPLVLAGFATLAILAALPTSAATITWTNTTSGLDWNTGANWSTGAKPTSADTALFTNALTSVLNASADQTVSNINFDTSAGTASGSFTLGTTGGNKFILPTNGIVQVLSTITGVGKTITINSPLVISNKCTIQNNASDANTTLNLGGNMTNLQTGTLTLQGSNTGTNTISGLLAGSSLAVTKSLNGNWIITSAITNIGTITGGGGNLILNNDNSTFTTLPAIYGGGTLNLYRSVNNLGLKKVKGHS